MLKVILLGAILLLSIASTGALLFTTCFSKELTAGPEDEYFE